MDSATKPSLPPNWQLKYSSTEDYRRNASLFPGLHLRSVKNVPRLSREARLNIAIGRIDRNHNRIAESTRMRTTNANQIFTKVKRAKSNQNWKCHVEIDPTLHKRMVVRNSTQHSCHTQLANHRVPIIGSTFGISMILECQGCGDLNDAMEITKTITLSFNLAH